MKNHFLITNKNVLKDYDEYDYHPKTKEELKKIIIDLLKKGETNLNCIDVSKITDMWALFQTVNRHITVTDIDISEWDVSNVQYMNGMFCDCSEFNADLSKWDVSNVEWMTGMFNGCKKFNSDIRGWNIKKLCELERMFKDCVKFDYDLSCWKFQQKITKGNIWGAFEGCTTLFLKNKFPSWKDMDL